MQIINALGMDLYIVEHTKIDDLNPSGYLTREVFEGIKLPKLVLEAYCVSNATIS
jgi:hypothetical protein